MQRPHHAISFRRATGRHALGVATLLTVLATGVSVVTAPFVLPTVTAVDPGEALQQAVIAAAIVYVLVLCVLLR